jgi:hypothetical protein
MLEFRGGSNEAIVELGGIRLHDAVRLRQCIFSL